MEWIIIIPTLIFWLYVPFAFVAYCVWLVFCVFRLTYKYFASRSKPPEVLTPPVVEIILQKKLDNTSRQWHGWTRYPDTKTNRWFNEIGDKLLKMQSRNER